MDIVPSACLAGMDVMKYFWAGWAMIRLSMADEDQASILQHYNLKSAQLGQLSLILQNSVSLLLIPTRVTALDGAEFSSTSD